MATILVVDDELGIRALLSEILTDEGHTVELAEDAAQARSVRESLRPDLVLLDMHMPELDGFAATEAIRRQEAAQGGGRSPEEEILHPAGSGWGREGRPPGGFGPPQVAGPECCPSRVYLRRQSSRSRCAIPLRKGKKAGVPGKGGPRSRRHSLQTPVGRQGFLLELRSDPLSVGAGRPW